MSHRPVVRRLCWVAAGLLACGWINFLIIEGLEKADSWSSVAAFAGKRGVRRAGTGLRSPGTAARAGIRARSVDHHPRWKCAYPAVRDGVSIDVDGGAVEVAVVGGRSGQQPATLVDVGDVPGTVRADAADGDHGGINA